ncbi:DedA family protein [Desulfurobacterium sp.]|uniref:DedA family protein n=1 Tax=Desulfurobacterium sp. TaxID=2004706 RepID=UPI0026093411|nr:DedA family protein [Desulfurobacterium sp.]
MDVANAVSESLKYLESNPHIAGLIIGLWAFLETALLLGLVFPAEKILIVGSVLVARGYISPVNFVLSVVLGTVAGYTVSFFFGYWVGERTLKQILRKFKVGSESYEKVRQFVVSKGEITLVFGRFIAVFRSILPVVMGAFKLPFISFTLWNIVGAFLWAIFYLVVGDLIDKILSIIITNKIFAVLLIAVSLAGYYFWRRYEKNRKGV